MRRVTQARLRFLLLAVVALGVSRLAAAQRGMTPEDTLRVATVADAQVSPDGSVVAYTVSTVAGGDTQSELRLVRADDPHRSQSLRLVGAEFNPSRPRWSPDGRRIAFLGGRGDQTGVWIVSPTTGSAPRFVAAVRSTNFHISYAGEALAWSPDSHRIAYVSASEQPSEPGVADRSYQRTPPDDPRVIDRIQYKSRTAFSDRLRSHVWVTEVDSPAPRQLTFGSAYDHAIAWNPRGEEIAFLSNHEIDPDATNNSDIFAVAASDGRVRQLTDTRGCEYDPAWSPDGKLIAYTATTRDITTIDSVAEDAHVWVLTVADGNRRELSAALDRRARAPQWSADGRTIFFLAGDRGQTFIYRVGLGAAMQPQNVFVPLVEIAPRARPEARRLRPFQVGGFSVSSTLPRTPAALGEAGRSLLLAFTLADAVNPAEVYALVTTSAPGTASSHFERLSDHNGQLTRSINLVEPEELNFESFDGTLVQGWLMKSPGWRGGRAPLILSVHGGPHGMYGYSFNPTFQAYAARGYAVLFINPRGSTGYGQKFSDGTLREWGGGDYKDLMAGLDFALKKYPWLDANRMGVTGGSYGGFMTNWIITQTPRFRAAVSSASVSNLVSFYATSLYQDLIHAEFGGFPWDDYDLLWRWSPLRYVRDAQTPTLFIHGEQDNDVHITQAEEMYMALRRRNIDTVLVRYPREGHGLREPRHRLDALERTLSWFDKYLK